MKKHIQNHALGWEHTLGMSLGADLNEIIAAKLEESKTVSTSFEIGVAASFTAATEIPENTTVLLYGVVAGEANKKQVARYVPNGFEKDTIEFTDTGVATLLLHFIPQSGGGF